MLRGSKRAGADDDAAVVGRKEVGIGRGEGGSTWSRATDARGTGAQAGDRRVFRADGWVANVGVEREAGTMGRKIWKRCWRNSTLHMKEGTKILYTMLSR
jgi:hypothetical protein